MKSSRNAIGVGAFKAKCLAILEQVRTKRETVLITKRGKPIAEVIPVRQKKTTPNDHELRGSVIYEGDVVSPIEVDWRASK